MSVCPSISHSPNRLPLGEGTSCRFGEPLAKASNSCDVDSPSTLANEESRVT